MADQILLAEGNPLFRELLAKMGALLRRAKGMVRSPTMEAGSLTLDPAKRLVTVNGEARSLPPRNTPF